MRILLTGAAGEIGRRLATRLNNSHEVVAVDQDTEALTRLADSIDTRTIDLTDTQAVQSELTGLEVETFVSAVGGYELAALEDCSPASFTDQLETNLTAVHTPLQTVLPKLRAQAGRVVLIGSMVGSVALPYHGAYSAAKAGVSGYADALRRELAPHGVTVSLIEPGPVRTGFNERAASGLADRSGSVYADTYAQFASYSPAAADVETVVERVITAVETDRPRARDRIGRRARWLPRLQSVLPTWVFDRLIRSGLPGGVLARLIDR